MRIPMLLALLGGLASPLSAQAVLFDRSRSVALAPGQWSYAPTAEGSEARFGSTFAIRCIRASRLVVVRRPDAPAPAPLTIATDMLVRSLPAGGTLGATDPLLDAIAFSRGRVVVEMAGAARLVIPASPEAARSIEDCRN